MRLIKSETLGEGFSRLRETTIKIWGFMCISLGERNFHSVLVNSWKITQVRKSV